MKIRVTAFSMVLAAAIGCAGLMSGVTLAQQGSSDQTRSEYSNRVIQAIAFDKVPAFTAFSQLASKYGVPVAINGNIKGTITLSMHDAKVEDVLQAMVKQVDSNFLFKRGLYEINLNAPVKAKDGTVSATFRLHHLSMGALVTKLQELGYKTWQEGDLDSLIYHVSDEPSTRLQEGFGGGGVVLPGEGGLGGRAVSLPGQGGFGGGGVAAAPAQGGFGGGGVSLPGQGGFGGGSVAAAPAQGGFGGGGVAAAPAQGGFGGGATVAAPAGQHGGLGGGGFGGSRAIAPARAVDARRLTPMPTTGATSITQDDKYLYILRGNELVKVQKSDLRVVRRGKV